MVIRRSWVWLLAVLMLSACGGGGGGTPATPSNPPSASCPDGSNPPCQTTQGFGTGLQFADPIRLNTLYTASAPFSGSSLPAWADLTQHLPFPGNQGMQNSCVGWAVGYGLKTYQEQVEQGWGIDQQHTFSPAYIYNQINRGVDQGSSYEAALNLVQSQGVAPLSSMPYSATDFRSQPSAAARSAAAAFTIDKWARVDQRSVTELKSQISAGNPVLIGVSVDYAFQELAPGAIWTTLGTPVGRHAMLLVGYDDSRRAFRLMNSWGRQWSDDGYGWISYDLVPTAVNEAYVALDSKKEPTPTPNPPAPSPTPQPSTLETVIAGTSLSIFNINFQWFLPNGEPAMRFEGGLTIPTGATANAVQIVIRFYLNNGTNGKGAPVGALYPNFAIPPGQAATGTPPFTLAETGFTSSWYAVMPYLGLNVPRGGSFAPIQTNLVAEPTLYVNNIAVRTFPLVPLFVRL
jgi:hypothetical protein